MQTQHKNHVQILLLIIDVCHLKANDDIAYDMLIFLHQMLNAVSVMYFRLQFLCLSFRQFIQTI